MTDEELVAKTKKFKENIKSMKGELTWINQEQKRIDAEIEQNQKKIKLNKQLPHLVSTFMELLELPPETDED